MPLVKTQLTWGYSFSPSTSSSTSPWRQQLAMHPREKSWPTLASDQPFSEKPLATSRLHRDAPTQGHTFKNRISPNFIDTKSKAKWEIRGIHSKQKKIKPREKLIKKSISILLNKMFKLVVIKMLWTQGKNRGTQWELQQRIKKYNVRKYKIRLQEYNNWTEKYTRKNQQQVGWYKTDLETE